MSVVAVVLDKARAGKLPATLRRAMIAPAAADESGSALVIALMAFLVLSAVGLMVSITVSEDFNIARNQVEVTQCLYIAEGGLDFAISELSAQPSWSGLPYPGRTLGAGYFVVYLSDSTSDGLPLPSGQKRINVKAKIGSTEREIEAIVQ